MPGEERGKREKDGVNMSDAMAICVFIIIVMSCMGVCNWVHYHDIITHYQDTYNIGYNDGINGNDTINNMLPPTNEITNDKELAYRYGYEDGCSERVKMQNSEKAASINKMIDSKKPCVNKSCVK
jgi:hypothetical protein